MELKEGIPTKGQERAERFLIDTAAKLNFTSSSLNESQKIAHFGLISDEALQYVFTINFSIVCGVLSLFGIITNIINIIVFVKMKFKETINIALLALSVSDFCSLLPVLWNSICLNPYFMYSDNVPIYSFEVHLKTGNWTHFIFVRVTAFITAYITLERCLCIVFPLKVKQLLTHKRVVAIIIGIYSITIAGLSPNYATANFAWKFIPQRNRTMIGFVFADNRLTIQTVSYVFNVLFIFVSFVCVTTCSSVLIWKLNLRSKWLRGASSQDESPARDRQVIKMVVWVAVLFMVCFTPSLILFFAAAMVPEYNIGKRYENLFIALGSAFFVFDAINSSTNIFIYYRMSSRYCQMFKMLFFTPNKVAKQNGKSSEDVAGAGPTAQ